MHLDRYHDDVVIVFLLFSSVFKSHIMENCRYFRTKTKFFFHLLNGNLQVIISFSGKWCKVKVADWVYFIILQRFYWQSLWQWWSNNCLKWQNLYISIVEWQMLRTGKISNIHSSYLQKIWLKLENYIMAFKIFTRKPTHHDKWIFPTLNVCNYINMSVYNVK